MAATNFKTENNTFRKLIGNGLTYRIPRFQRDYSWTNEEWEDLWSDILGMLESDGETAHYMGYLVLQSADDKSFDVIDGQQRLTTISLIVIAVLKNLQRLIDNGNDPEANKRRADQIRQTYVGYLDPVTLVARPKLTLIQNKKSGPESHRLPSRQPHRYLDFFARHERSSGTDDQRIPFPVPGKIPQDPPDKGQRRMYLDTRFNAHYHRRSS